MAHYKTTQVDYATLYDNYPHDPQDPILSVQDYIEDQFSQGWSLLSFSWHSSSSVTFVFVPNAQ